MSESGMCEIKDKEPKRVLRLPPCPPYDVEGMESWLADMAERGLMLRGDGFFAGFAVFEKAQPCAVRYRLDAAPVQVSALTDDTSPEEAVELNRAYGWRYVARRRQFFIYRSEAANARELNTDPAVQALALDLVRRRERGSLIATLCWMVLYPLVTLRGEVLLTSFMLGPFLSLAGAALLAWALYVSLARVLHLRRLRKKLAGGEGMDHGKNWQQKALLYRTGAVLSVALLLAWFGVLLGKWSDAATRGDQEPLASYTGTLPFATIADIAGEGEYSLRNSVSASSIRTDGNWLAPRIISLYENAAVMLPGGRSVEGILYVDYYETASPCLAREIARELLTQGKRATHFEEMPLPALDVDYAFAFNGYLPTLIVQKGNRVMRVAFLQTSENDVIPFDDWVRVYTENIG